MELTLFHDTAFNQEFKKVLETWNTFLKSSDLLDKLDISQPEKTGSWISQAAKKAGVWHEMKHDPKAPGYGFDSWNSFFIRKFIKGARTFHGTENDIYHIITISNLKHFSRIYTKQKSENIEQL